MIKQLDSHFDLVASSLHTKYLGDMIPYEGCSIQVIWSGITGATGYSGTLQVVQSNDAVTYDDITPLVQTVTTPTGSVTFEHNQFEAAHVALKNTPGTVNAGAFHIHIVRRSAT